MTRRWPVVLAALVLPLLVACSSGRESETSSVSTTPSASPCWEIDWEQLGLDAPPPTPTRAPGDDGPSVTWCTPTP